MAASMASDTNKNAFLSQHPLVVDMVKSSKPTGADEDGDKRNEVNKSQVEKENGAIRTREMIKIDESNEKVAMRTRDMQLLDIMDLYWSCRQTNYFQALFQLLHELASTQHRTSVVIDRDNRSSSKYETPSASNKDGKSEQETSTSIKDTDAVGRNTTTRTNLHEAKTQANIRNVFESYISNMDSYQPKELAVETEAGVQRPVWWGPQVLTSESAADLNHAIQGVIHRFDDEKAENERRLRMLINMLIDLGSEKPESMGNEKKRVNALDLTRDVCTPIQNILTACPLLDVNAHSKPALRPDVQLRLTRHILAYLHVKHFWTPKNTNSCALWIDPFGDNLADVIYKHVLPHHLSLLMLQPSTVFKDVLAKCDQDLLDARKKTEDDSASNVVAETVKNEKEADANEKKDNETFRGPTIEAGFRIHSVAVFALSVAAIAFSIVTLHKRYLS